MSALQTTHRSKLQQEPCPAPAPCPFNFEPPLCSIAEPQAPRDLLDGAPGEKIPKAATLNAAQADFLPLTNIHFHLGAEHRAKEYQDGKYSEEYDADPNAPGIRPGWECVSNDIEQRRLEPYEFQYCKSDVSVGRSYEVHYVHSSAGFSEGELDGVDTPAIDDGLGGAANGRGILNPMIVVEAVVYQIVRGGEKYHLDAFNGWNSVANRSTALMYQGSTTGTSYNNTVCSPFSITWHVDRTCHRISPQAFDNLCKQMKEVYGLENDLKAKSSRVLLDPKWVVKPEFVIPYDGSSR